MTHQLLTLPKATPLNTGVIMPGAKALFYLTTTTTPTPVYTTSARTVAHSQPVIADAAGILPAIYLDPLIVYKLTLTTTADVLYYTQDPVNDQILSQGVIGAFLYPITAAETTAVVTPTFYNYPPGDIRRYGAVGDNLTNNATAIQAAINVASVNGGTVFIPEGIFRFTSALSISTQFKAVRLLGASREGAILRKAFSGTGIAVTNFATPTFESFTLDKTGTDTGIGIKITAGGNQTVVRNIVVTGHGSHGIEVNSANLATFQDVQVLSNGGDGLYLNGAATPDVNALTLFNIDARGNTGWGVNFNNAWANFCVGITAQSNTAGGVRLNNARQSCLQVYSESNAGPQIELVNTVDCKGNILTVLEGAITYGGTTADRNTVIHMKRGAVFDSNFSKVTANRFLLPSDLQDGTSVQGQLEIKHTTNGVYELAHSGLDSDIRSTFTHNNASFRHRVDMDVMLLRMSANNSGAGQLMLGSTHQGTVGAAGGASVLPGAPRGYLLAHLDGTPVVFPYWAAS